MPEEQTTIRSDIMRMACNVARFHYEKLDGSGYPDKLKGDAIHIYLLRSWVSKFFRFLIRSMIKNRIYRII